MVLGVLLLMCMLRMAHAFSPQSLEEAFQALNAHLMCGLVFSWGLTMSSFICVGCCSLWSSLLEPASATSDYSKPMPLYHWLLAYAHGCCPIEFY